MDTTAPIRRRSDRSRDRPRRASPGCARRRRVSFKLSPDQPAAAGATSRPTAAAIWSLLDLPGAVRRHAVRRVHRQRPAAPRQLQGRDPVARCSSTIRKRSSAASSPSPTTRTPYILDEINANGWMLWPPIRYSYDTDQQGLSRRIKARRRALPRLPGAAAWASRAAAVRGAAPSRSRAISALGNTQLARHSTTRAAMCWRASSTASASRCCSA